MSCSGLHCAGCAGGAAAPVVPLAAAFGLAWVAEHIIEVAALSLTCGVLAVAVAVVLERRTGRRAAAWGAARGIRSRADVILPPPQPRAAIAPQVVNFNFYGADAAPAAAVIRKAIEGK